MSTQSESIGVYVPVSELVPWDQNPRLNESAVDEVAKSIKRFGFASPIIARTADNMVIAGHTRLLAAKKIGLKSVPVRFMDLDLNDAQLLALADNKIGEIADWDETKLKDILASLDDQDLSGLGWSDDDLKSLLDNEEEQIADFSEDDLGFKYQILIEDLNEETQADLFEELEKQGYKCRPLTI